MEKNLIKINDWYGKLVIDLRRLTLEGIIKTKHAIGKRILEDELKLGKPKYGSKKIEDLADDLAVSRADLYFCIQFAKKYPELSNALENLSWREIVKLLPEHIEERELTINSIYEAKLHQNKIDRRVIIWESKRCPRDVGLELIKDQAKFIEVMREKCQKDAIELIRMERKIGGILNWFEKEWLEVYNFIITYKEKGEKLNIYKNLDIVIKKCNTQIKKLEKETGKGRIVDI